MDALTHLPECDDRRMYRADLIAVAASLLPAGATVRDRDIDDAIATADRLIRKVDRFVDGPTDRTPPLPLAEIDDAA